MKNRFCFRPSRRCLRLVFAASAALLLGACARHASQQDAAPPAEVSAVAPVRQTFHIRVTAFGQLAADSRNALSLSLPQAGLVVATTALAGQRVTRGEALLRLQTDPATRSAYLQAKSAVTVAREDLTHTERLHAEKLATNTQLDAARKALADAQAALAARAKLGGAQAIATLRAPADGVVTALDVQRGQRVPAGTRLVEFAPRTALTAQLGVDPGAAAGIRVGAPVSLSAVYAKRGAPALAATVALVGDAVSPATHLVSVVATLNGAAHLPAGTALSARIQTTSFTAWAVPRDALQSDAQGSYVFQIVDGKARRVDVKVLAPAGSPVGVAGALDPSAPVITLGSYEVGNGTAVRTVRATGADGTATR
ncbi:MAG TPA: efflux RND transporter periplasmic adaptor subunit [Rhodanobacteraceae bacterium]